ncbi:MAG: rhodanese-like domain-containing protein [Rhodospirillales bacterium]|nr:rhodanese-like domain-containing protein [Rhodospirillales bacterium]
MSSYAGDISPRQAWDILTNEMKSVLIDVRTPAEWNYVGIPDLASLGKKPLFVPWLFFPSMEINPQFAEHLETVHLDRDAPLLFICRSGARSRSAAMAMSSRGYSRCYNVASGFEGDPDQARHRGTVNGWKMDSLPWVQG